MFKARHFALVIFCLFCVDLSFSQSAGMTSKTRKVTLSGNVYNKVTGEKLSDKEISTLISEYPNINFETEVNSRGVTKYLYDPENIKTDRFINNRSEDRQVRAGERFPDFVFQTVEGETLKSSDLSGSVIVLRFELFTQMTHRPALDNIQSQISSFDDRSVVPIICYADSKANVKKYSESLPGFHLVADGTSFHERYNIVRFPTTVVIDEKGIVLSYFSPVDDIDLVEVLGK